MVEVSVNHKTYNHFSKEIPLKETLKLFILQTPYSIQLSAASNFCPLNFRPLLSIQYKIAKFAPFCVVPPQFEGSKILSPLEAKI